MTVEYVEKVYNRTARFYDLIFGKVFDSGREMTPDMLRLFAGARLLEVGVGTGLSLPILPRNVEITGIDLSEKMLEKARGRVEKENLRNVNLLKMDATHLDFPDDSFDRVLAAYFISTVPEPSKVVEEMKRVCRPGGYLLFINHFQHEIPVVGAVERWLSPAFYRIGFRTDLRLSALTEQFGLEIEEMEAVDFCGHWKAVRCFNPAK